MAILIPKEKQRTSFRCVLSGSAFKSEVDLQDKVYLDRVSCERLLGRSSY